MMHAKFNMDAVFQPVFLSVEAPDATGAAAKHRRTARRVRWGPKR